MEKERSKILFEKLKKCIADTFLQEYSTSNPSISDWKGIEIVYFQEHLLKKVKANVSEKWFYTYFKSEFEKLPRIDMLNLLSQYAGYKSWAEFCDKNNEAIQHLSQKAQQTDIQDFDTYSNSQNNQDKKQFYQNKLIQRAFGLLVLTCIGILVYIGYKKNTEYELYFYDSDKKTLIKNLELKPLFGSKATIISNKEAFYTIETDFSDDSIVISVNSNYYKADTIQINLSESTGKESISLEPNDYANILYYYSKVYNKEGDSKKIEIKRKQLSNIIDGNALIYQYFDNDDFGLEIYTKQQYIDFLTTPTTSLKNLEIIKTKTNKGKIVEIRFKIKENEK